MNHISAQVRVDKAGVVQVSIRKNRSIDDDPQQVKQLGAQGVELGQCGSARHSYLLSRAVEYGGAGLSLSSTFHGARDPRAKTRGKQQPVRCPRNPGGTDRKVQALQPPPPFYRASS